MWIVTLKAIDPRRPGQTLTETVRIHSNYAVDLLANDKYTWSTLERAMTNGTLREVKIDYKPMHHGGKRHIRRDDDGLFYLEVNGIQVGPKTQDRGEAWSHGEVIAR